MFTKVLRSISVAIVIALFALAFATVTTRHWPPPPITPPETAIASAAPGEAPWYGDPIRPASFHEAPGCQSYGCDGVIRETGYWGAELDHLQLVSLKAVVDLRSGCTGYPVPLDAAQATI